jgi:hypothetical protein
MDRLRRWQRPQVIEAAPGGRASLPWRAGPLNSVQLIILSCISRVGIRKESVLPVCEQCQLPLCLQEQRLPG